jgi:hypothetical protein
MIDEGYEMIADLLVYYTGCKRPALGDPAGVWIEKIRPAWERMQKEKSRITFHAGDISPAWDPPPRVSGVFQRHKEDSAD